MYRCGCRNRFDIFEGGTDDGRGIVEEPEGDEDSITGGSVCVAELKVEINRRKLLKARLKTLRAAIKWRAKEVEWALVEHTKQEAALAASKAVHEQRAVELKTVEQELVQVETALASEDGEAPASAPASDTPLDVMKAMQSHTE